MTVTWLFEISVHHVALCSPKIISKNENAQNNDLSSKQYMDANRQSLLRDALNRWIDINVQLGVFESSTYFSAVDRPHRLNADTTFHQTLSETNAISVQQTLPFVVEEPHGTT